MVGRIAELEAGELALSKHYENEILPVLTKTIEERETAKNEVLRRTQEIFNTAKTAQDNNKIRDRLLEQEKVRASRVFKDLNDKIASLERQRFTVRDRARAEIEAKIHELKQQRGLEM